MHQPTDHDPDRPTMCNNKKNTNMRTRNKLFCDMAGDLFMRYMHALDNMMAWAKGSRYTSSPWAFDLRACRTANNIEIDEISYNTSSHNWVAYNDGLIYNLESINLNELGEILDWIEYNYSYDHKCAHWNI